MVIEQKKEKEKKTIMLVYFWYFKEVTSSYKAFLKTPEVPSDLLCMVSRLTSEFNCGWSLLSQKHKLSN